jgi:hypothetical protein
MSKKGSNYIPDPHRGLHEREDFDRLCHVEVQEEVNSFLMRFATHDPDDHTSLKLVSVNPDGERRNPNDYLCFWHPEIEALRLKTKLFHPEMGSDEDREAAKFHEHYAWIKNCRTVCRAKDRIQKVHNELVEKKKEESQKRQEEWEQQRMEEEC